MYFDMTALPPEGCDKLMHSVIVPRPIAWIVTMDANGVQNLAPFSFFNAVSGNPPIVAIGIGPRRGDTSQTDRKDTATNIATTGEFVINLVSYDNSEAMNLSSAEVAPEVDEIALAGLDTLPSVTVRPPRLAQSPVALECRLRSKIELLPGRTLILGDVTAMHIADDAILDAERFHVNTPMLDLVGRMHGGGWYARTSDLFQMARPGADVTAAPAKASK